MLLNIQRVLYINLTRRPDRGAEVLGELQSLRIPEEKIIRIEGVDAAEVDVYMIEISTHFPAAVQRLAEANIRPCRQPHQQQKQRPHDDGSQTPELGTVREAADSRGYAVHGRSASCAAHLLVTRHLSLVGVALSTMARLVARRLRVRPSKRGGSSQQQKQRVSPPVQTPRQCCLGGPLSLRSARGGVDKQSWTTCEKDADAARAGDVGGPARSGAFIPRRLDDRARL